MSTESWVYVADNGDTIPWEPHHKHATELYVPVRSRIKAEPVLAEGPISDPVRFTTKVYRLTRR